MSKESISALLHQLGNMVEQGCFDNISEEVIDGAAARRPSTNPETLMTDTHETV